jgi:hypothetical protein
VFAIIALLLALLTGNIHTYGTATTNQGVYVDFGHGTCVGYETTPGGGLFGNTLGLAGGDCS